MSRLSTPLLAGVLAFLPVVAHACGACIEDKIAATYDHAVIDRAVANRWQVVFVAIDGPVDASKLTARIVLAAPRVRGVRASTVRTSVSPPAFSFALDAVSDPRVAVAAFQTALGDRTARLTLVRMVRDGVLVDPKT
jgi:hypothetical protein